jgi:uncharacterized membrane-anchored protein YhcB (DUF1043 family)
MRSPEQLRAEVRRLHLTVQNTADPDQRQVLAERALELAQQAEIIENLPNDIEGLRIRIAHYSSRLAVAEKQNQRRVLAEVLQEAEDKLQQVSSQSRTPRPHRVAAA